MALSLRIKAVLLLLFTALVKLVNDSILAELGK